jgi:hypothetical protein
MVFLLAPEIDPQNFLVSVIRVNTKPTNETILHVTTSAVKGSILRPAWVLHQLVNAHVKRILLRLFCVVLIDFARISRTLRPSPRLALNILCGLTHLSIILRTLSSTRRAHHYCQAFQLMTDEMDESPRPVLTTDTLHHRRRLNHMCTDHHHPSLNVPSKT